jgi:transcriptional regulator with XRE-family HTH domain
MPISEETKKQNKIDAKIAAAKKYQEYFVRMCTRLRADGGDVAVVADVVAERVYAYMSGIYSFGKDGTFPSEEARDKELVVWSRALAEIAEHLPELSPPPEASITDKNPRKAAFSRRVANVELTYDQLGVMSCSSGTTVCAFANNTLSTESKRPLLMELVISDAESAKNEVPKKYIKPHLITKRVKTAWDHVNTLVNYDSLLEEELARALGVSVSKLSGWRKAGTFIDKATLEKIHEWLSANDDLMAIATRRTTPIPAEPPVLIVEDPAHEALKRQGEEFFANKIFIFGERITSTMGYTPETAAKCAGVWGNEKEVLKPADMTKFAVAREIMAGEELSSLNKLMNRLFKEKWLAHPHNAPRGNEPQ